MRKGYIYQWSGTQWIELDPEQHSDKYMSALNDLLSKAPDGAFNNLFCMNLIAQKAFIKYLQALEITLSELTENGQTKRGSIKSSNFQENQSGFKINYDGNVEFNNLKLRGLLDANLSLLGNLQSPLVGAVRGRYTFRTGSVHTEEWIKVTKLQDNPRKYKVDLPNTLTSTEKDLLANQSILQARAVIAPLQGNSNFIIPCEVNIEYGGGYFEVTFTGIFNGVNYPPTHGVILLSY